MARLFQPGFRNHSTSNWEHDNASDCSGSLSFDSASRALCWRKLIRLGKKLIKKTPKSNARQQRRLWALDEVHFQQQGSRCRMWVPPETKDPIIYHHPTRKSI